MNPKIQRNFEVFTHPAADSPPCDSSPPSPSTSRTRASSSSGTTAGTRNKMRGQRDKRAAEAGAADAGSEIIDVSEHKPRRIPSAKWRELIKKVWEADPLLCPKCQNEMRIVALIDERDVIERILRHLGLWEQGVRVESARDPPEPAERVIEPWLDDPFPDYDTEPVFAEN